MNARIEITKELLSTLPSELVAELRPPKRQVRQEQILDAITCQGGRASIDEIIISVWIATETILLRRQVIAAIQPLRDEGAIKSIGGGVYKLVTEAQ